jgi:hypothetical protein
MSKASGYKVASYVILILIFLISKCIEQLSMYVFIIYYDEEMPFKSFALL